MRRGIALFVCLCSQPCCGGTHRYQKNLPEYRVHNSSFYTSAVSTGPSKRVRSTKLAELQLSLLSI